MTRTFTYTFTLIDLDNTSNAITLKKRVTDSMEPTNCRKAGYAARYFNNVLRKNYGYHKSVVTAARVCEVK